MTAMIQQPNKRTIETMLRDMGPAMLEAMPKHISADRMLRIALTALRTNSKFADCSPASFLGSVLQASQLGLEVNTQMGHAYLVPYKEECSLIIGYQGMMELARRSGQISNIYAFAVYVGDEFDYCQGLNPDLKHKPGLGIKDDKNLTHVYAVAKMKNGEPMFVVLTRADVDRYRSKSAAANSKFWVNNYEAMALKTVVRRLFRWLPKSAEMAIAVEVDRSLESDRPQLSAMSSEVMQLLQSNGIDTSEADRIIATDPPAVTTPAQNGQRLKLSREPGQEG